MPCMRQENHQQNFGYNASETDIVTAVIAKKLIP